MRTARRWEAERALVALAAVAAGGALPEPATWAMLMAGFGLVGGAARARRSSHPART